MPGELQRPLVTEVLASLRALATELDRLDQVAADRFHVSRTDLRALDLVDSRGPITPTALAALLGFTTGGITGVVDRLESAGYVRRLPDLEDRRRLRLEATPAVRETETEVFGPLLGNSLATIGHYADAELRVIHRFLEDMRQTTSAQAEALVDTGGGVGRRHAKT